MQPWEKLWQNIAPGEWRLAGDKYRVMLDENYGSTYRAMRRNERGYFNDLDSKRYRKRHRAQRACEVDAAAKDAGRQLEQAYPWGYRSEENEP